MRKPGACFFACLFLFACTAAVAQTIPAIPAEVQAATISFLIEGQAGLAAVEKLQWNEDFLLTLDMSSTYAAYLAEGGLAGDIPAFAEYLTDNAPIPENWEDMAAETIRKNFDAEITRMEMLVEDRLYQVYIMHEGQEVPFVTISPRTGYFHG